MKLGPIALQIRACDTRFGNDVAGAADLMATDEVGINKETAFVVPLAATARANQYDPTINQEVIERFGVLMVLRNDTAQSDKLGLKVYDTVHEARAEIFKAVLGLEIPRSDQTDPAAESIVYYAGERLFDMDRAWLKWLVMFEVASRLTEFHGVDKDVVDNFNTIYETYVT